MVQLEERIYTKQEIADILCINVKDKNFKRNVENTLTKWGYNYEYPPYSKTITITYVPIDEDKLAEILIREYGLDIQIDVIAFACFIHAFNYVNGFASMPWGERTQQLNNIYGVEVCERTLRNWANKLINAGTLNKSDLQKTYWKSAKISDSLTIREPVEKQEYVAYFKFKNEEYKKNITNLITTGKEDLTQVKSAAYKAAHLAAMAEFGGWCYYSCKSLLLSSFDEKSLTEILELVEDIAPYIAEFKAKEDAEAWQRAAAQVQKEIEEAAFYF